MCDRAKVIHRQGSVDVLVSSEPLESAMLTYGNIARSIKQRALSVWGVRFEETPNSLTAIWPQSPRLPDGWSERVTFIEEKSDFFLKISR